MTADLSVEESVLVQTVRAFVDRDVKPTVREVEHANEYLAGRAISHQHRELCADAAQYGDPMASYRLARSCACTTR